MATTSIPSATDYVGSHFKEAIKTHSVYDGSNRLIEFYTANVEAEHGKQCMVTYYSYVGATDRIENTKEALSTWDSSWDI